MNQLKLFTVGHVLKELIRFPDKEIGPVLGGPAAYSAVTASRLGVETGIVTHIGRDMPSALLQPLQQAGIDMSGIKTGDGDSRTTILSYDNKGNKNVVYEKVAPPILFRDVPEEYLKAKAALICPMDFEVPISTIHALHNKGIFLMADLGGFGGTVATVHPHSVDLNRHAFLQELLTYFPIIKASFEYCSYLFGLEQDPEAAGNLLIKLRAKIAIITMGGEGSQIYEGHNKIIIPPFPTKVVDTTGAGDAFCGAFLVEYVNTNNLNLSASFASAAASLMIEDTGGVRPSRMPTIEMVRKRLSAQK